MALLLLYFFTWRSVLTGSAVLGLVLFAFALNALAQSPYSAYALALLAFVGLAVPYLSAAFALRKLISSRSLGITPHLPLRVGIVMLLLTLLTAAYVPFVAWLCGIPTITFWLGLRIFVVASLYTALVQLLLPSRHAVFCLSLFPFAFLILVKQAEGIVARLLTDDGLTLWLALLTIVIWLYVLSVLARNTAFKPAWSTAMTDYTVNNWIQGTSDWRWFKLGTHAPAAGTLLLAYPASVAVRLVNIGGWIMFWPLVSVLVIWNLDLAEGLFSGQSAGIDMFLLYSLLCGCLSCWSYGEVGARARLLWLRTGSDRTSIWKKLERELWINFALLLGVAVTVAVIVAMIGYDNANLWHYPLIIIAFALFDGYRSLCARLYAWPSLVEAMVMLLATAILGVTIIFSLGNTALSLLPALELGLLALAALFRFSARARFTNVDWQVLKLAVSKRAMVTS
jgi:hypothetical protein